MKLLVSDYDGTLKSDLKNLRINIDAIRHFMSDGHTFCIATGRPYNSMKKEIDLYNIPYDYLICNNGLTIFDRNGNLLYGKIMNIDDILFFLDYMKIPSNQYFLYNLYGENANSNVVYIGINNLGLMKLREIKKEANSWFEDILTYQQFNNLYLESSTNKAVGIKKLIELEKLPFEYDSIYTVGDCMNDIEMLQEFNGYKVLFSYPCLFGKKIKTCGEVHKLIKRIMR